MSKPVFILDEYVVTFEAEAELTNKRKHFRQECGWTESMYRHIERWPWFTAVVTLWKDGKELATETLGCCCYKDADEFWTRYKGEYFADMVRTAFQEAGQRELGDKAHRLLAPERYVESPVPPTVDKQAE